MSEQVCYGCDNAELHVGGTIHVIAPLSAAERLAFYRQRHTIRVRVEESRYGGYLHYCVHDGIRVHATRSPRTIRAWRHDGHEIARLAAGEVAVLT